MIPGWGETVQLMVAGEKRRAWIPEELAYKGRADRPQGMLVFDIELVSFTANPTAAPADVATPPADAQKTKSGLAYKVLKAGTGTVHPKRSSQVTVHYTGLDDRREDVRQLRRDGASRPRSRWIRSSRAGPRACS